MTRKLRIMLGNAQAYYDELRQGNCCVHNDPLGTPQALTDEAGQVVWTASYDPFGKATVNEDPDGDGTNIEFNVRMPGQYYDKETGLYQNGYRTYNPDIGRYLTADPAGLLGGPNTYLYVNANPINWFDSTGLFPSCESIIVGLRRTSKTEKERRLLFSDYGLVFQSSGKPGVGPNLDPRMPGQIPIRPELIIEIWSARTDHVQWTEYLVNKTFQKLKVFCEETRTDKCGNTRTFNFNSTTEKLISEKRDLLRTYTDEELVLLRLLYTLGI